MSNSIVELNTNNFAATVSKGVVLVDFWATWCMPCLMQSPILEKVSSIIDNAAIIAKVNVDSYPELAEQFAVDGIPTLLLFRDGDIVERLTGIQSERILLPLLQNTAVMANTHAL